jgi:hypothetical protein
MIKYTPEENKERQEALYRFLLSRGDHWTPSDMATSFVIQYPAYFGNKYHSSNASRLLSSDIQAINGSGDYDCIIISGNRGIKLATEAEYERFVGAELKEIFDKLRRVRKIISKGRRDMQMDMEGRIAEAFLKKEDG